MTGGSGPARRAYLDHAATTALRPAARDAYLEAAQVLGNPTSVHASGRRARAVLDDALGSIAADLGVPRSWILLTSGGTEADNLALRGAALAAHAADPGRDALAVCASDHPAVLETARALAPAITAHETGVDAEGRLRLPELSRHLAAGRTGLVSVALVNNETGVLQDLAAISAAARAHGTLVHTDAVQATGHVDLPAPGIADLITLSGHKIGAPVGVGVLVADPAVPLAAQSTGGGQQRGVRSGTLDAAHAAAFAAALHETLATAAQERARLAELSRLLEEGIRAIAPDAVLPVAGVPRSPHIVHALLPGADQDALLFLLDQEGADVSAGSACTAGVQQPSHVLDAMGRDQRGSAALRLSLGWTSRREDVELLLSALPGALERARAVGSLSR